MSLVPPTARPDDVWDYWHEMSAALDLTYRLGLEADRSAHPPEIQRLAQFAPIVGRTVEELQELMTVLAAELELEVCLALAASIEARIREDFESRPSRERSGSGPGPFTALERRVKRRKRQVPGLEELLDAWKEASGMGALLGGLKQAVVGLRNWLAHGRRGPMKGFAKFDPGTIRDRAEAVQTSVVGFPTLFN